MPEMVMQMPGRHGSLCSPFLMDQIIQTAFHTKAPLCRTYIRNPKEHFCSFSANSVGTFHETCHHERSPVQERGCVIFGKKKSHNSGLFLPRYPDPAGALYAAERASKTFRHAAWNGLVSLKPQAWTIAHGASRAGRREQSMSYDSQGIAARWNREHLSK